ncbi:TPA: fimbrial protein [Escherichia coli]|nr:fimbrial protein [Escherichia coli]HAH6715677.1 fimbrial protein [Escherichia coli]HAX8833375.1 fimbrial protein [Escherichia coli]
MVIILTDSLLSRFNKLNVPLYLHPGLPLKSVQQAYFTGFSAEVNARLSMFAWGWHHEAGIHLLRLMLSGAFDKYPNLQVISGHWGEMVELGQVRSSRLAKAGDLSSAVGFNIKLNDCDTNVSSNAAVAFLGTTVTSNDDTLALQSSAAGSAQNVGIQILDRTGEVLILDGATFSAKTDLIDGTNILPFQARYIALGQSVAGTANADATFKVQYL